MILNDFEESVVPQEEAGRYKEDFFRHEEQAKAGSAEKPLQKSKGAQKGGVWVGQDFGLHDPACSAEAAWVAVQGCRQKAPADGDGQKASEVLLEVQELDGKGLGQ
jgi:hypothetical protein